MKIVALICRILLALLFIVPGLNILHPFLPMPTQPLPPLLTEFMQVMMTSGWMKLIGAVQVIGALLVLFGGTVPLGLCLLCPVTVNILACHALLQGGNGIVPGLIATALELVLIYAYRGSFAGILSAKQRPTV